MKHVFVIHSNITYLAVLGVMIKENIHQEDVVIVSQMYEREVPIKCHRFKQIPLGKLLLHPFSIFSEVKRIDSYVESLVHHEKYIVYVEALYPFHSVIATNKLCVRINFIEEGFSAYPNTMSFDSHTMNYDKSSFRYLSLKDRFRDLYSLMKGYPIRLHAIPSFFNAYYDNSQITFYGFGEDAFNGVSNKVQISLRDVKDNFQWESLLLLKDVDIWLGTNCCTRENYPIEKYLAAIHKGMIQTMKEKNRKRVLIKFHPVESEESKKTTIALFENNDIEVQIIPNDVILELELFNADNIRIYAIDTSILIYASFLGISCTSLLYLLEDFSLPSLLPTCWRYVNFLK